MTQARRTTKSAPARRHHVAPSAPVRRPSPRARSKGKAAPSRSSSHPAVVEAIPASPALRERPAVEVVDAELLASPAAVPAASEEEQIESSKYLPRNGRPRLFEEERFLFPETYGFDRVRLLVKDPEWLFAHWDVSPATLARVRSELGQRTAALSRLTLRVTDAVSGGDQVILVPEGARAWYVRADPTRRSYRAEIGLTLPSGHFRPLAQSNTITTPWVGPAAERASRVVSYRQPLAPSARVPEVAAEPWQTHPMVGGEPARSGPGKGEAEERGGASDRFRR